MPQADTERRRTRVRGLPRLWRLHAALPLAPLAACTTAKPLRHVRSAGACGAAGAFRPPPEGSPLPLGLSGGSCTEGPPLQRSGAETLLSEGFGAGARAAEEGLGSDGCAEVRAEAWWRWAQRMKGAAAIPESDPENPHGGCCMYPILAEDPLAMCLAVGEGAAVVLAAGAFSRLVELVPPGYETGFEIPITVAGLPAQPADPVLASGVARPVQLSVPPGQGSGPGLGSRSGGGGGGGGGGGARSVVFFEKPLLARVTTRREQHERVFKAALLAAGRGSDPSPYPGLPLDSLPAAQAEGSGLPEPSNAQLGIGAGRAGNGGGTAAHAMTGDAAGLGLCPRSGSSLSSEEGAATAAALEAELAGADAGKGPGLGLAPDPGAGAAEAAEGSGSGPRPNVDATGAAAGATAGVVASAPGSRWAAGSAGAAAAPASSAPRAPAQQNAAPAGAPAAEAGQGGVSGGTPDGPEGVLIQCALT